MQDNKRSLAGFLFLVLGCSFLLYALLGNYIALPGYLRFLERGRVSASGNSFDMDVFIGAFKTVLWLFSFQLGVIFLCMAGFLKSGISRKGLIGFWIGAGLWLGFAGITELPRQGPAFFVIFGSTILLLVGLLIDNWAKVRSKVLDSDRRSLDLRMLGYVFFGLAAWDVCGFGSMGLMLDPDKAAAYGTGPLLVTQSSKVMIEFVLGFVFSWMSLAGTRRAMT